MRTNSDLAKNARAISIVVFSLLISNNSFSDDSLAIIIGGGGTTQSNYYNFENDIRLFDNVLSEHGYSKGDVKVFFNDGADSKVTDYYSSNPTPTDPYYGVRMNFHDSSRPNRIKDLITGPAKLQTIKSEFQGAVKDACAKKVKRVVFMTVDHGTANTNDYKMSYITLAGDEKLSVGDEEQFAQDLGSCGSEIALIGTQCFSGQNMDVALHQSNACAFSASPPFEETKIITEKNTPKGAVVPPLGNALYTFLFSCALHSQSVKDNQAAYSCPKDIQADFDGDHKVSLAEAHFYALSHMDPTSSPQISSQVFALDLLSKNGSHQPTVDDLASVCHAQNDSLAVAIGKLGDAVTPTQKLEIESRLNLERAVITKLLSDDDLLKLIHANKDDSMQDKVGKLEYVHRDFEDGYARVESDIRTALTAMNQTRTSMEEAKKKAIDYLLYTTGDPDLKANYQQMLDSQKRLEDGKLPDDQLQIEQVKYDRAVALVNKTLDTAFSTPPLQREMQDLQTNLQRESADFETATNREETYLSSYAAVRRAHDALAGYYAEGSILKNGNAINKSKLVQLYECENQSL